MIVSGGLPALVSLSWAGLAYALCAVFVAAVVRGYSGFGLAALTFLTLSLLLPPARVVPITLVLEGVASIQLLPSIWSRVDWRTLGLLLVTSALTIPLGVHLLATVPAQHVRLIISILVLVASVLIWRGYGIRRGGGPALTATTGLVAGIMTGLANIGGLAIVVMLLSTFVEMAVARATIVAIILPLDVYTLAVAGMQHLITRGVMFSALLFLIPLFVGVGVGRRCFNFARPETFRRFVLALLMVLSVGGIVRSLAG